MEDIEAHFCSVCCKTFTLLSSLRRHVKKFHEPEAEILAPYKYKKKENYEYSCEKCGKNFSKKNHWKYHMRKIHKSYLDTPKKKSPDKKCPLCSYESSKREILLTHFEVEHEITLSPLEMKFPTYEKFIEWKEAYQEKTMSSFIVRETKRKKGRKFILYICHRSGFFISASSGKRSLKLNGSHKINGYCPARIEMHMIDTGECTAKIMETHVGHENDIQHLNLSTKEKQWLVDKLAANMSFEDIMDEVDKTIMTDQSDLKRIHLITKKDLYNIRQQLLKKINLESSSENASNVGEDECDENSSSHHDVEMENDQTSEVITYIIQEEMTPFVIDVEDLEQQKRSLIEEFTSIVHNIQSSSELKILQNALQNTGLCRAATSDLKETKTESVVYILQQVSGDQ